MLRIIPFTKIVFFYSSRIRTLLAMATFSSHRLIMGKKEIYIFYVSLGTFEIEMFKNLLLRNDKGDEAETWHTCLG